MIFVSVAAFCDPWLVHTVRDACAKASAPAALVFGVFEQDAAPRQAELQAVVDACGAMLRYGHVHPVESRGVCWARAQVGAMYAGESHLLQIDSHMLFEPGWDAQLLAQHAELLAHSAKPVISVYPWGFEIVDGEPVVKDPPSATTTLVMRPVPAAELRPDDPVMMFRTEHIFARRPLPGCHVAGGFLFAAGSFVREVPYDPELYFHGEEQSLALRAWTRGWDIWHPPRIPLYHLYKQPDTAHRAHHWHPEWEALRSFSQAELTARARARLADLVYQRRDLGEFGLGCERSLQDYAAVFGIDYAARSIDRDFDALYRRIRATLPPVELTVGHDTALADVPAGSVDVLHLGRLHHLYPHQVQAQLAEAHRALASDGYAVISCPDLRSVCALVLEERLTDPLFTSATGPLAPLDLLYGHRGALAAGHVEHAHRCGFTERVLQATLRQAGFAVVASVARPRHCDIRAVASKSARSEDEMRALLTARLTA